MIFSFARRVKAASTIPSTAFRHLSEIPADAQKRFKKYVAPLMVAPKGDPPTVVVMASLGTFIFAPLAFACGYCFKVAKLIRFDDYDFEAFKKRTPVD
jgi:hypothetical protein